MKLLRRDPLVVVHSGVLVLRRDPCAVGICLMVLIVILLWCSVSLLLVVILILLLLLVRLWAIIRALCWLVNCAYCWLLHHGHSIHRWWASDPMRSSLLTIHRHSSLMGPLLSIWQLRELKVIDASFRDKLLAHGSLFRHFSHN